MDKVRMFHPGVDGEIEVLAPAVRHHRNSGWRPVSERSEPEKAPAPAVSPVVKADPPKSTTSGAARPNPGTGSAD